MTAVGNLKSLRTLTLIQAAVTDSDLANLKGLTSLRELYLADTSVTDAGLENLKGLIALHRLDLRQTHVTGARSGGISRSLTAQRNFGLKIHG